MARVTLEELKAALDGYFNDRSRPAAETRDGLQEVADDIDTMIASLDETMEGD